MHMARTYTRRELTDMDTIRKAWDGDMLKIEKPLTSDIYYQNTRYYGQ